jgi:Cu(I)/Ag(I) efflux system membrane fusion protein
MDTKNEIKNQKSNLKEMGRLLFGFWFLIFGFAVVPACTKTYEPSKTQAGKVLYHCAMHPQIIMDHPGECPICHMKLVRIEANVQPAAEPAAAGVSGQATIHISPAVEQRIGVQVTEARVRDMKILIRASARVAYDPQLYSAALEHREARKLVDQARHSDQKQDLEEAQETLKASALRLRQMGLSEDQMAEIAAPGYDLDSLLVGSRKGNVWVYADVFDNQLSSVHVGQQAELTSSAIPGKTFIGSVRGIDPIVNSDTRTARARILVRDHDNVLKPGIYLSAVILANPGAMLAVPEGAVIDTGVRQLVYVQSASGTYQPRVVKAGRQGEGYIEIVEGLEPGEKVATAANFLIDSESRIQAAAQEASR